MIVILRLFTFSSTSMLFKIKIVYSMPTLCSKHYFIKVDQFHVDVSSKHKYTKHTM